MGLLVMFPAFPISGFAVSVTKARTLLWGLDTGASAGKQRAQAQGAQVCGFEAVHASPCLMHLPKM